MDLITVDLGNSRCKLVLWSGIERRDALALDVPADDTLERGLAGWLANVEGPVACALSSVASPAVEGRVREALERVLGAGAVRRPDHRLAIDSPEPAGVGDDRLFAARGAVEHLGTSALVLDAGTALTVDAVRVDGERESSEALLPATFLGGAIAPGPRLLAEALARGAARLPRVEPVPAPPALGKTTVEAIRAGVGLGFRGAALELARRVASAAGLAHAPALVTGGAADFLCARPPAPDTADVEALAATRVDDLVHLGLRDAALAAARAAAPEAGGAARA